MDETSCSVPALASNNPLNKGFLRVKEYIATLFSGLRTPRDEIFQTISTPKWQDEKWDGGVVAPNILKINPFQIFPYCCPFCSCHTLWDCWNKRNFHSTNRSRDNSKYCIYLAIKLDFVRIFKKLIRQFTPGTETTFLKRLADCLCEISGI